MALVSAIAKSDNGLLLLTLGRATAAEKEFHSAKILFEKMAEKNPYSYSYRQLLAFTCDSLCQALSDLGRHDEALAMIETADERSTKNYLKIILNILKIPNTKN